MNKREMAKHLRKFAGNTITYTLGNEVLMSGEIAAAAAAALEREADAEEKAKPKVTLKEQVNAIRKYLAEQAVFHEADGICRHKAFGNCDHAAAAADTLRRLDDEGGKLLDKYDRGSAPGHIVLEQMLEFLRSLGVESRS